jgi:hypothetical protein
MMVITVSGQKKLAKECRKISGEYYFIGDLSVPNSGDCYKLKRPDGKVGYYMSTSNKILFNYTLGKYVHVESKEASKLVKGIIGYDSKNHTPEYGHFELPPYSELVYFYDPNKSGLQRVISEEIFDKTGVVASPYLNAYLDPKVTNPRSKSKRDYQTLPSGIYNMKDIGGSIKRLVNQESEIFISNLIEELAIPKQRMSDINNILKFTTFGFEIETSNGMVFERDLYRTGFFPLKDGSTSGHEYTSEVKSGANGLFAVQYFSDSAHKVCTTTEHDSLHIHFGNVLNSSTPDKKAKLIAFYFLLISLRNDLWGMLPAYKNDAQYFYRKQGKNHCQDLPKIPAFDRYPAMLDGKLNVSAVNRIYNDVLRAFNGGNIPDGGEYYKGGVDKWHIPERYKVVNFWNFFFGKNQTLEFRMHSGTTNPIKIMAWFWICNAILNYAMDNYKEILTLDNKYRLMSLVQDYYITFKGNAFATNLAKTLPKYIDYRTERFQEAAMRRDMYCDEFAGDNDKGLHKFRSILI